MRHACRGRPAGDIIDRKQSPGLARLFLGVAAAELAVVFLLPWPAAAAAGAWPHALTYFGPVAVMTAVNIALEGRYRRAGRVLSVYASTGANNLWRLCAYCAGEEGARALAEAPEGPHSLLLALVLPPAVR